MKAGDILETKFHGQLQVIEYKDSKNVVGRFLSTGYVVTGRADSFRNGNIRDRLAKTICGVGFLGLEDYSAHPRYVNIYQRWRNMIVRCNQDRDGAFRPSYLGCSVCPEWCDLSKFFNWCINHSQWNNGEWELDKDILLKGNKVYSPETCSFVPTEINNLFIKRNKLRGAFPIGVTRYSRNKFIAQCQDGKGNLISFTPRCTEIESFLDYKTFKESVIKSTAETYKSRISDAVYQAMMGYEVEITD